MGNALGLGLVSVVFFGSIDDRIQPSAVGKAFGEAFQNSLWWVVAVLGAIFVVMFALPARPKQHVEGAAEAAGPVDREPVLAN
jgi:hypothetical protein